MQASGDYCEYRGRRLPELFVGADWVAVPASAEDVRAGGFPDALATGESHRLGPWVKLPRSTLDREVKVTVWVTWQGERCSVAKVDGDEALLYYDGRNPERAAELGMEGSNYMGWSITAPVAELEQVDIEERQFA